MVEATEIPKREDKEDTKDENLVQNTNKKNRPTPESVAMDRGVQNIARKAHKNSKGDDKKLGREEWDVSIYTVFSLF